MNRPLLLALALVVLLVPVGTVAGIVTGEPNLTANLPDNTLIPGEERALLLTLTNDADLQQASLSQPTLNDRVTTARGIEVTLEAGNTPLSVESGPQSLGSLSDGSSVPVSFQVSVDEDAAPGTYRLPAEVTYTYTRQISEEGGAADQRTRTQIFSLEVRIKDAARFQLVETAADVWAGEPGTVSVTLENAGTEAARETAVTLRSPSGVFTLDGAAESSRFVGTWAPGERRTLSYAVRADEAVRAQPYTFELQAAYRDASGVAVNSDPIVVGVTPVTQHRFAVVDVVSSAVAESSGTVRLVLRNDGPEAVRDATITLSSPAAAVAIDGGSSSARFVGTWAPGETRVVTYDLDAAPDTTAGAYSLSAQVSYTTADTVVASRPVTVGITLAPRLEFALDEVTSTLYVGEPGTIRGTVVNQGDRVARNAVVVLESGSPQVVVRERAVAVGDLGPGEAASFALDVEVTPAAGAGPRPFSVTVEYESAGDHTRSAEPVRFQREVAPDREFFEVEPVNATFAPDSTNRLVLRLTNVGEARQGDIVARLQLVPPFTSVGPEAYLSGLEPGESALVAFELTVDEDAVTSTTSLTVNVTAEPAGSDHRIADPYRVAIAIMEPTRSADTVSVVIMIVLGLAIVGGVWWWWTRRR